MKVPGITGATQVCPVLMKGRHGNRECFWREFRAINRE